MNKLEEMVPCLVAELHAQSVRCSLGEGGFAEGAKQLHSPWERLGEASWRAAKIAIKSKLKGLGYAL